MKAKKKKKERKGKEKKKRKGKPQRCHTSTFFSPHQPSPPPGSVNVRRGGRREALKKDGEEKGGGRGVSKKQRHDGFKYKN